jgi:plasmid stabilization system protein ParE
MKPYDLAVPARLDLTSIRTYLTPAPRPVQTKILASIRAAFHQAVQYPYSGLAEPDYSNKRAGSVRSLLVYPYRIFYRSETQPIVIVAILHGAQDIASILRGRLP